MRLVIQLPAEFNVVFAGCVGESFAVLPGANAVSLRQAVASGAVEPRKTGQRNERETRAQLRLFEPGDAGFLIVVRAGKNGAEQEIIAVIPETRLVQESWTE